MTRDPWGSRTRADPVAWGHRSGPLGRWADRLAASDPGFNRLILATRGTLSLSLVLLAEWVLFAGTGALGPAEGARGTVRAALSAQRHDALVIVLLVGGLVALMAAMNVNEGSVRAQAATLALIGSEVLGSLVLGLLMGPYRAPGLVVMVLLLVGGTYGRRFGPRGSMGGVVLFTGYFLGFFLAAELSVAAVPWLAAVVVVALGVSALVRFTLFRPSPERNLRRALRSFSERSRRVFALATRCFSDPGGRWGALHRELVRLDEAALMIEAQLVLAGVGPARAAAVRQHLFDVELATTNIARFAEVLGRAALDPGLADAVRGTLNGLATGEVHTARCGRRRLCEALGRATRLEPATAVVLHRLVGSLEVLADARWPPDSEEAPGGFELAVGLRGGWLPGSSEVSMAASSSDQNRHRGLVRLPLHVRAAVQVGVATAIAIAAGDALDPSRFYWAAVAALLALVGTNTSAEQIRKALSRVAGTFLGVLIGEGLARGIGHGGFASAAVVVAALFVGMYLFRVEYAAFAMAVTVALSQVYLALGELSPGLLSMRLAETAVGAGAAILTVLLVVPLRTGRVVLIAASAFVTAVEALIDEAAGWLADREAGNPDLRLAARRVDAAYQALVETARPLGVGPWSDADSSVARLLAAASAARNYARNVVSDAAGLRRGASAELVTGCGALRDSAGALSRHLSGDPSPLPYVRSASLFTARPEPVAPPDRPEADTLLRRDFMLLDGALAAVAAAAGQPVTDLDAAPAG